ncbi:hypothetical protein [Micromonospora sp. NPDC004551]|uniref:hypothetical protein n=1 Tax=Micromonospora sp. NPDC004551 TaxID=3154284 RepID=UPI0033A658E6
MSGDRGCGGPRHRYGSAYQNRVDTGSQNWTQDALNENDEIWGRLASRTLSPRRFGA